MVALSPKCLQQCSNAFSMLLEIVFMRLFNSLSLGIVRPSVRSKKMGLIPTTSLPKLPSGTTCPVRSAMKWEREVMAMVERYGVVKVTWRKEGGRVRGPLDSFGFSIRIILTDSGKFCFPSFLRNSFLWISSTVLIHSRVSFVVLTSPLI